MTRTAVVTGGGAGIGKACALRFAKEGWKVALGDLSAADGEATVRLIQERGGEAVFVSGNVADESNCREFARAAHDTWGRIDALVANAGARVYGSLQDATEQDWET